MVRGTRHSVKVEWSRGAHTDVERLWACWSERDSDYADRVERRLRQAGALLGTFPRLGRPSGKNDTDL